VRDGFRRGKSSGSAVADGEGEEEERLEDGRIYEQLKRWRRKEAN